LRIGGLNRNLIDSDECAELATFGLFPLLEADLLQHLFQSGPRLLTKLTLETIFLIQPRKSHCRVKLRRFKVMYCLRRVDTRYVKEVILANISQVHLICPLFAKFGQIFSDGRLFTEGLCLAWNCLEWLLRGIFLHSNHLQKLMDVQ
jgi:hypothetical protein